MPDLYRTFATDFDVITKFEYSEPEVEIIKSALQALRPGRPILMELVLSLLGSIDSAVVGTRWELPALLASLALKEEQLKAAKLFLKAESGTDAHIADAVAKDRPALERLVDNLFWSVQMERQYLVHVQAKKWPPRTNPIEQSICDACANVWLQHGGRIENGGAFASFFAATAVPKFNVLSANRLLDVAPTESKLKSYIASRKRRNLTLMPL